MKSEGFPKADIEQLFYENYNSLTEQDIIEINNNNPSGNINNVVVGLQKHCYGVSVKKDPVENYQLFYINGQNKLEGDSLQLSLKMKHRENLTFFFSSFLAHNYEDLDPIDVFNTFQSQTRSMLETVGFFTVDNETVDKYENPTFMAVGSRGIIKINFIDRLTVYRELFEKSQFTLDSTMDAEYVYLMLNKRNNYIKIGKSKNPIFREKTLQADEPDVELIVAWQASSTVEKELHRLFPTRRKRGEWFDLNLKDMKAIRDYMKKYK